MKTLCVLTLFIGLAYFFFGIFCLISPVLGYSPELDTLGRLSLDEIGVYAQIAGSILWGASLITLANISKKKSSD